jgi:UDP-glucuronate decarboxylase
VRQYNSNKRILVTGGAGFLGSHLIECLLARGDEVICVDNLFTGNKRNIEHLLDHKHFEFMRHDVTFPLYLEVDQIYNLACPASPVHYQHDPVQTIKTSVHGAINMLGLAKRVKARIFQASTSEVYGDPVVHPQPETYWGHVNPIGIRSCYDEGKRCAETLFFDYHRQYQTDIRVARIFNTYGPRMHPNDGRVVSNFIVQALQEKDITIYGEGQQTRSFCYVDDLIEGFIRFMDLTVDESNMKAQGNIYLESNLHGQNNDQNQNMADSAKKSINLQGTNNFPGPINLGNPNEFTIRQLAEKVIQLTGSKSNLVFLPLPGDDPKQRQPDISLAEKMLGWQPRVQLEEGLKKTIGYFDQLLVES